MKTVAFKLDLRTTRQYHKFSQCVLRLILPSSELLMPAYSLVRSIQISADAGQVYQAVCDFNTWPVWSPWLISEPDATVTISLDGKSEGSVYSWTGDITGQGEVEHRRLVPNSVVEDEIRFLKPFRSKARVSFQLQPVASGTRLSWTMDGHMPWFLFWMIPFLKTFIGMDYSRGLRMLKDWLESGTIPSKVIQHGIENAAPLRMAGIANSCEVEDVGQSMESAFRRAREIFQSHGLPLTGPMISVYTRFHIRKAVFDYISGFVIPDNVEIPASSALKVWSIPASRTFRVEHIGSYHHLGNAWSVVNQVVRYRRMKQRNCGSYEIYRTTPPATPNAELQTDIYLPLK